MKPDLVWDKAANPERTQTIHGDTVVPLADLRTDEMA